MKLEIMRQRGSSIVDAVRMSRHFCIHPAIYNADGQGWCVTHTSSGMALLSNIPFTDAVVMCERFEVCGEDWDFGPLRGGFPKGSFPVARRIRESYCAADGLGE